MIDRLRLGSTDGPVEHIRISCPQRDHYLMPLENVPARAEAAVHRDVAGERVAVAG